MAHPSRADVVLVGGALPNDVVEANPLVSAAAAKWQMAFAEALSSEWGRTAICLSYLPVARGEPQMAVTTVAKGITIIPVVRVRALFGDLRYFARMVANVWALRKQANVVFSYNALIWTAPWAWLLSRLSGAPMIMIVADFEPLGNGGSQKRLRYSMDRWLLRLAKRFVLLSPNTLKLMRAGDRSEVFNGLADENALACDTPVYGGTVRFVYAGSLVEGAGVRDFIGAAERVSSTHGDCEFHVFGRGPVSLSPSEHLAGRLFIHGFVPETDLYDFLGRDCVGVNPRATAGMVNEFNTPFKVLLYLSRGIATMTTETEGLPKDLAALCLVATAGPIGLSVAMERVLEMSPGELARRASAGREAVRRSRSAPVLASAVQRLLDCSRAPGPVDP
jgi:glycosyltransferase involved in cell wall biosynthesis